MRSMNISIKEEAYRFLKALKSGDKSFSDVILEFKHSEGKIMKFFGVLKNVDWAEREKMHTELRKSFNRRLS